jgi:hypothetical protein
MAARYDASEKKFDGRLEFKPTEATIGEYDKETFIKVLKDKVNYHGQQSFYHLATPNGDVLYLLEKSNAHAFTVKEAIAQHIVRMNEPDLGDEGVDALDCFKCYDEYELATGGGGNGGGSRTRKPKAGWKYVHPADPKQVIDGHMFCKLCKCSVTGNVGFKRSYSNYRCDGMSD